MSREREESATRRPVAATGPLLVHFPNWLGDAVVATGLLESLAPAWGEAGICVAGSPAAFRFFGCPHGIRPGDKTSAGEMNKAVTAGSGFSEPDCRS